LEKITPVESWFFPLGIPSAIVGLITIWVIFLIFRFLRISLWYKSAIAVFLAGVITNQIISYYVNNFLNTGPRLLNNIINTASCVVLSVVLFILGRNRSKARSENILTV
jgi:hypothetical protein